MLLVCEASSSPQSFPADGYFRGAGNVERCQLSFQQPMRSQWSYTLTDDLWWFWMLTSCLSLSLSHWLSLSRASVVLFCCFVCCCRFSPPHAVVGHTSFLFSSNQKLPICASRRWSVQTLHDWPVLSSVHHSVFSLISVVALLGFSS